MFNFLKLIGKEEKEAYIETLHNTTRVYMAILAPMVFGIFVLAKEIMDLNEVSGIVNMTSTMKSIDDMMNLLNYVVIVLIVAAGLLAFVVLYNLANVNISERIRELATIKVLGFYDKEVYDYVARETVILTIIGIGLGLVRRIFLELLPDGYL